MGFAAGREKGIGPEGPSTTAKATGLKALLQQRKRRD
ncbi:DUF6053 domain-containing protein [Lysobacter enzymogenes]